jgi:hypothetical protein
MSTTPLADVRARYDTAAETPVAQVLEGILVLAGLYVAVSPWLLGAGVAPVAPYLVAGPAVAVLGFGFAAAYATTHRIAWTMPVLGAWVIVSSWLVAPVPNPLIISNVVAGAVVVVCGLGILRPDGVARR